MDILGQHNQGRSTINHGRKSRRKIGPAGGRSYPPPDFVIFQNFKHQIACITMQKMPKLSVMAISQISTKPIQYTSLLYIFKVQQSSLHDIQHLSITRSGTKIPLKIHQNIISSEYLIFSYREGLAPPRPLPG